MFWLLLGSFFTVLGVFVLDWKRVGEWMPASLTGALYAGVFAALPITQPLHTYRDTGPITGHHAIELLVQLTIAPVVSAWYVQGLPRSGRLPIGRTAGFVVTSLIGTGVAIMAGRATFTYPLLIVTGTVFHYLLIWRVHTYFNAFGSPDRTGNRSARME